MSPRHTRAFVSREVNVKNGIVWQAEEAQAQARRMDAELEEARRLLGEAQAESEELREMVAGWEEAFAQAQKEIEQLKAAAAAAAPREVRMHAAHM